MPDTNRPSPVIPIHGAAASGGPRRGLVAWLTGLSGAGKTTLARAALDQLRAAGIRAEILDGDEFRQRLGNGLGFSRHDREVNVRHAAYVAGLLADQGAIVLVAMIAPYRQLRAENRKNLGRVYFEVYLDAPLEVCEARDPKGLYHKARSGEIRHFTGLDDPYEAPDSPDLVINTGNAALGSCVQMLVGAVLAAGRRDSALATVPAPVPSLQHLPGGLREAIAALPDTRASLTKIAGAANMSRQTAAGLIRRATGKSFRDLKRASRLAQAEKLLRQGWSVKEIALSVGFSSTEAFDRFYRRHCGTSPNAARRPATLE